MQKQKQTTKLDLYPYKHQDYARELAAVQVDAHLSSRNKELLLKYHNYKFARGNSEITVYKRSYQLRAAIRWLKTALFIERDLDVLTKEDLESIIAYINRLPNMTLTTKGDYRRSIKEFYNWFKRSDARLEAPDVKDRMNAKGAYEFLQKDVQGEAEKEEANPSNIITEDDVILVLNYGCKNAKEMAFISLLHETGARAGEFLNLRINSLQFQKDWLEVAIPDGKTGRRQVCVVRSIPYLRNYLQQHQTKHDSGSFLWLSDASNGLRKPILHMGAQKLVRRCWARTIEALKMQGRLQESELLSQKRHNLHWFRHSRATILAPKVTESVLCKHMGWVLGSDMTKVYVHLCTKDMRNVMLAVYGIKQEEDAKPKNVRCMCGTHNEVSNRYCMTCYRPLSLEIVEQDKDAVNQQMQERLAELIKIAQDPELFAKFTAFKQSKTAK